MRIGGSNNGALHLSLHRAFVRPPSQWAGPRGAREGEDPLPRHRDRGLAQVPLDEDEGLELGGHIRASCLTARLVVQ